MEHGDQLMARSLQPSGLGMSAALETARAAPLVLRGRSRSLLIGPATFLAPMEGVTDACFRGLVMELGGVGAACTDFIRLCERRAPGVQALRRRLGTPPPQGAVGVQFMAPDAGGVAEAAAAAEAAGAAFVDLNFGCPAPRIVEGCAGSALLEHPDRLAAIVAAAVAGTGLPVSAKIRVGITDDAALEEILDAAAGAGAAAICLHARRRCDPYSLPARWEWIARATTWLARHHPGLPLIGNGSVVVPGDLAALRATTGCQGVMIGAGAIADPFVFRVAAGGPPPDRAEAAAFVVRYVERMAAEHGLRACLGRLKRLVKMYTAGGLLAEPRLRRRLQGENDTATLLAWFRAAAAAAPEVAPPAVAAI